MRSRLLRGPAWSLLLAAVLPACGRTIPVITVPHRPQVEFTAGPVAGDSVSYVVELHWVGSDADGHVVGYDWALDPPALAGPGIDTAWVRTPRTRLELRVSATRPPETPPAPGGGPLPASDYHTVVVRAVDNEGLRSPPAARSFTAWTVAPSTDFHTPDALSHLSVLVPPTFRAVWRGSDPDGARGTPVRYRWRLVRASELEPQAPEGITSGVVQAFFTADAPRFEAAGWDSLAGDSTSLLLAGLEPGVRYLLAMVAFDEAGAYEPRFDRDRNVLDFFVTLDKLGPKMEVWNEYFHRAQFVGGISLAESRIMKIEFPSGLPLALNWGATPTTYGRHIAGYRWALDLADVFDETPRQGGADLAHWSAWSPWTTSARLEPFVASGTESPAVHHFFLEARDDLGSISLFTIRLTIVEPGFDSPLLLVDDLYGTPTQLEIKPSFPGEINLAGVYPFEAEQDSFHVARGGFPDSLLLRAGVPGALSRAGAFADFAPDTLDYRFHPFDGIELSRLMRYRAVCWYTDHASAARVGAKFGSVSPATALRTINSVNRFNTLAAYQRLGGHVWLFGEGATPAIAVGYWSRYGNVPRTPYTSGDDPRQNVLFPGNFLYDFCHLRSGLALAGGGGSSQLVSCLPFLPAWRPTAPGAARTAERWPDLPRLTLAAYRGSATNPFGVLTWYISRPNTITSGSPAVPVLDTLYLYQAAAPDGSAPNGFPNAVHYHGPDNGPGSQLVWFGFPLHYFEPEQARAVVAAVMRNFGIQPASARGRTARR